MDNCSDCFISRLKRRPWKPSSSTCADGLGRLPAAAAQPHDAEDAFQQPSRPAPQGNLHCAEGEGPATGSMARSSDGPQGQGNDGETGGRAEMQTATCPNPKRRSTTTGRTCNRFSIRS